MRRNAGILVGNTVIRKEGSGGWVMPVSGRRGEQRYTVPGVVAEQHQERDREGNGARDEEEAPRTLPPEAVPVEVLPKSTRLQRVASILNRHLFGVDDVSVAQNADELLQLCSESVTDRLGSVHEFVLGLLCGLNDLLRRFFKGRHGWQLFCDPISDAVLACGKVMD